MCHGLIFFSDLSMTTDKLGPQTVEEEEEDETEPAGRPRRDKSKALQQPKETPKSTTVSKTVKSSPATRSSKSNISKGKEVDTRGSKKSSESEKFQEIMQEAELITASIVERKDTAGDETVKPSTVTIKVERESSGDDSDENMYDDEYVDDVDHDDDLEAAISQATGADSTDMSQETDSRPTPSAAKKRKVPTKPKVKPKASDQGGGDTPYNKVSRYTVKPVLSGHLK